MMSDFSITRLGPITGTGDAAIQPSQPDTGSQHRRQRPDSGEPEPADDIEPSDEEKHDLDRLA
jgi:hypothetical protein